ncbi:hypothetical protein SISSUDRAFT_1057233 [Sistotremastrum suecicum HHB10207 ss-3]|uniref:Uncharacterized protein n=1 Tax=Sistotremastrum suecicum HHB10207 ss-3 TaxID=1314776 RepID=A0A166J0R5_9AGAM|nr:hypothetical protein SISSUDRAFT_1057233 [Sistotremastrum suecicum HHB10207 ss-3]
MVNVSPIQHEPDSDPSASDQSDYHRWTTKRNMTIYGTSHSCLASSTAESLDHHPYNHAPLTQTRTTGTSTPKTQFQLPILLAFARTAPTPLYSTAPGAWVMGYLPCFPGPDANRDSYPMRLISYGTTKLPSPFLLIFSNNDCETNKYDSGYESDESDYDYDYD